MTDPTLYNTKVRSKYLVESKKRPRQVTGDSQLAIELWSINDLVERSLTKDEAIDRFKGMHGFSMSQEDAHRALDKALMRKFGA
jgi:hypothetical protein